MNTNNGIGCIGEHSCRFVAKAFVFPAFIRVHPRFLQYFHLGRFNSFGPTITIVKGPGLFALRYELT